MEKRNSYIMSKLFVWDGSLARTQFAFYAAELDDGQNIAHYSSLYIPWSRLSPT